MELKEFVKATIEQIVEGAAAAQEAVSAKGAIINPAGIQFQKDGVWNTYKDSMPQNIEFDVALTSTDKKGSSEGVGVFLGSISLGKKNESGIEQVAITKVKFSIPVILPTGGTINEF
jgi:alpha-D-ribose 1-methylphosphonate 5-triphosphate diphosphatase PhnM